MQCLYYCLEYYDMLRALCVRRIISQKDLFQTLDTLWSEFAVKTLLNVVFSHAFS